MLWLCWLTHKGQFSDWSFMLWEWMQWKRMAACDRYKRRAFQRVLDWPKSLNKFCGTICSKQSITFNNLKASSSSLAPLHSKKVTGAAFPAREQLWQASEALRASLPSHYSWREVEQQQWGWAENVKSCVSVTVYSMNYQSADCQNFGMIGISLYLRSQGKFKKLCRHIPHYSFIYLSWNHIELFTN